MQHRATPGRLEDLRSRRIDLRQVEILVLDEADRMLDMGFQHSMSARGVYATYLIGDLEADFLDLDDMPDIATSDRQRLLEDDPRVEALQKYVQDKLLRDIENSWGGWRKVDRDERAVSAVLHPGSFANVSRSGHPPPRHGPSDTTTPGLCERVEALDPFCPETKNPRLSRGFRKALCRI